MEPLIPWHSLNGEVVQADTHVFDNPAETFHGSTYEQFIVQRGERK